MAAKPPPFLDEQIVGALADELSGESAKRNLDVISGAHRMRASQGFRNAANFIADRLRDYGLEDVEILKFPAGWNDDVRDAEVRPAWDVESAELWELADTNGAWTRSERIGHWESMPLSLAEDSESGDVTATLVDVGSGAEPADYKGKDVRGKLVLCHRSPRTCRLLPSTSMELPAS